MKESTLRADPSVAAVVPCYNYGYFLRRAVSSLQQQSVPLQEIVLVDDGSTDTETIELMDELSREEGIRLIRFAQNRGLSAARNAGISSVEVDYILLLDADDHYEPIFLEKALKRYSAHRCQKIAAIGCYLNFYQKNKNGTWLRSYIWKPSGGRLPSFLFSNECNAAPLLCKAAWEEVRGYDEQMRYAEDWEFWIRITAAGWQIDIIPLPLYNYYIHESNMSYARSPAQQKFFMQQKEYIYHKHRQLYRKHFSSGLSYLIRQSFKNISHFRHPSHVFLTAGKKGGFWQGLVVSVWMGVNRILDQVRIRDKARWIKQIVLRK